MISLVIFLMDQARAFRGGIRHAAEEREPIVLHLQFEAVRRDAGEVGAEDQSVVRFEYVDRRGPHPFFGSGLGGGDFIGIQPFGGHIISLFSPGRLRRRDWTQSP
jgi:hypothetical protein